jgi:hypothetical protein
MKKIPAIQRREQEPSDIEYIYQITKMSLSKIKLLCKTTSRNFFQTFQNNLNDKKFRSI